MEGVIVLIANIFWNTDFMLVIVLDILYLLSHFILTIQLGSFHDPYFTDEKTEKLKPVLPASGTYTLSHYITSPIDIKYIFMA